MKYVLTLFTALMLMLSPVASATSTGGTPNVPCFIDGELVYSSIEITKCEELGGSPYSDTEADTEDSNIMTWVYAIAVAIALTTGVLLL